MPVEKHIRDLAWVVVHWAKRVRPAVIMLENVEEFKDWGPLISAEDGQLIPCPLRKGFTFRRWVKELKKLGYAVEYREMKACDHGAPTIRKRLFLVARCDGKPIVWPAPSHGPKLIPYRTAAECIDWSIPCPSIFERKRPLAENTLRRIAKGIQRYVIDAKEPFIVNLTHAGSERIEPITEPLRTITGAHRGEKAIVMPYLAGVGGRAGQSPERAVDNPRHRPRGQTRHSPRHGEAGGQGGAAEAHGRGGRADRQTRKAKGGLTDNRSQSTKLILAGASPSTTGRYQLPKCWASPGRMLSPTPTSSPDPSSPMTELLVSCPKLRRITITRGGWLGLGRSWRSSMSLWPDRHSTDTVPGATDRGTVS